MEAYYEQILSKIEDLLQEKCYDEAKKILQEELSMPYIPSEVEDQLLELTKQFKQESDASMKMLSSEQLVRLLQGNSEEAMFAIEHLKKSNIRNHLEEIAAYLKDGNNAFVKAFLIEAMMEQNVSDTFTMEVDGLVVEFIPCFIESVTQCEGFYEACTYLSDWFESENPTFLHMCMDILVQESYLRLPFNIEECEALPLALAVACYVFEAHDQRSAYEKMMKDLHLEKLDGYDLLLKRKESQIC